MFRHDIDRSEPIEWQHPDNRGLFTALLGIPGLVGGNRWQDSASGLRHPDLTGTYSWTPDGSFSSSGTNPPFNAGTVFGTPTTGDFTVALTAQLTTALNSNQRLLRFDGRIAPSLRSQIGSSIGLVRDGVAWDGSAVTAAVGVPYRLVLIKTGGTITNANISLWLNGSVIINLVNTSLAAPSAEFFAGSITENGTGTGTVKDILALRRDVGYEWIQRDFEWFRNPSRDPRLRRLTGAITFGPLSGSLPSLLGSLSLSLDAILFGSAATLTNTGQHSATLSTAQTATATASHSAQSSNTIATAQQAAANTPTAATASTQLSTSLAASNSIISGAVASNTVSVTLSSQVVVTDQPLLYGSLEVLLSNVTLSAAGSTRAAGQLASTVATTGQSTATTPALSQCNLTTSTTAAASSATRANAVQSGVVGFTLNAGVVSILSSGLSSMLGNVTLVARAAELIESPAINILTLPGTICRAITLPMTITRVLTIRGRT